MLYLSVIIPAYNEEKRIPHTLLAIDEYLSRQDYTYEILVVIDGAKDNTANVVKKFQSLVKNLRVISNEENHGKGYVVRQGILEAKGSIRLFMDADNSTSIDNIEKMLPYFDARKAEVVIGSRDSKDAKGARQAVKQPFIKRLMGNMGNLLIQMVVARGIWDTQNGFKAFTARAARDIFSRARIDRWGFDIEVIALARRLGNRIAIIPVHWKNDPNSQVGWKGYFSTFKDLFIIRLNLWRNVYDIPKLAKRKEKKPKPSSKSFKKFYEKTKRKF